MKKLFNKKGMTLIEVIITIAIFAIVIQMGYSIYFTGNKSFNLGKDIGFVQQDVRNISTYINSEFRYIDKLTLATTDHSAVNFTGIYYSMEARDNGDDTYSLVRKKYEDDSILISEEMIVTTSTLDNPIDISISNTEKGKINIIVQKITNDQEYHLDFDIGLENNKDLETGIDVSLYNFNAHLNVLYYSYPSDYVASSK